MTSGADPSSPSDDDDSVSGSLTATERRHVVGQALPMLASYFAAGVDSLQSENAVASTSSEDPLDELAWLVRLRVLLAAAEKIDPLVQQVLRRSSFRYQRAADVSAGLIRGRLDTVKYLRSRHEISAPRTFPIIETRRRHDLPENTLATAALVLLLNEIRRIPLERVPDNSIELRRVRQATTRLRRLLSHQTLSECLEHAEGVLRKREIRDLVATVQRRIEAGHIPNPEAYGAIARWIEDFDIGGAASPGDLEWLFYDNRFDTRLFELWALRLLASAISHRLGSPDTTRLLLERSSGPIATWRTAGYSVELWFQAGLGRLNVGGPTWEYVEVDSEEDSQSFGGIPDITVVVEDAAGVRTPVIIDPKLRQRASIPGSELYKILGYFGNLPASLPKRGAIVFHCPGQPRSYRLTSGSDLEAELFAIGVDAFDEMTGTQFELLAVLATELVPKSAIVRSRGPADPSDAESVEEWANECQRVAVAEMEASIDQDSLERATKNLRSNLLETWELLDQPTRRMLATAEHFGSSATQDMDHSGPLLGLAAGCERVLRLHAVAAGVLLDSKSTLGRLLRQYREACEVVPAREAQGLNGVLRSAGVNLAEMRALIDEMFRLNKRYRIPAAHADVLEEDDWIRGRALILVGDRSLLTRLVRSLQSSGVPQQLA